MTWITFTVSCAWVVFTSSVTFGASIDIHPLLRVRVHEIDNVQDRIIYHELIEQFNLFVDWRTLPSCNMIFNVGGQNSRNTTERMRLSSNDCYSVVFYWATVIINFIDNPKQFCFTLLFNFVIKDCFVLFEDYPININSVLFIVPYAENRLICRVNINSWFIFVVWYFNKY